MVFGYKQKSQSYITYHLTTTFINGILKLNMQDKALVNSNHPHGHNTAA